MYFCVIGLDIDNVLEVVILTLSFARYGLIKSTPRLKLFQLAVDVASTQNIYQRKDTVA